MKWHFEIFMCDIIPIVGSGFALWFNHYELSALLYIIWQQSWNQRRTDAAIARLSALQDSNAAVSSTVE